MRFPAEKPNQPFGLRLIATRLRYEEYGIQPMGFVAGRLCQPRNKKPKIKRSQNEKI
jgi:hypothetical protein